MTSLADEQLNTAALIIVRTGETRPVNPYPNETVALDLNDTPPGFYTWDATGQVWNRVGELAP